VRPYADENLMVLEKIRIHNFRNFVESQAEFSPRLNVFLGENGQGKTNLLEALVLNLQGETFRHADNINLIRSNIDFSLLQGQARQKDLTYELKTQIMKSRKHHFLNGKRVTSSDLKKEFSVVIFSPESLASVKAAITRTFWSAGSCGARCRSSTGISGAHWCASPPSFPLRAWPPFAKSTRRREST
jgi:recombinational DNA repair ATPase RecF